MKVNFSKEWCMRMALLEKDEESAGLPSSLAERISHYPGAAEAHRLQAALSKVGVPCYVRRWHLGQRGWFVVHEKSYARLNFPISTSVMPDLSHANRRLVEQAVLKKIPCGCYFCRTVHSPVDIVEFSGDDSALCPNCTIDAILVGVDDEIVLEHGLIRWFTGAGLRNRLSVARE